jgi:hypothetical protein
VASTRLLAWTKGGSYDYAIRRAFLRDPIRGERVPSFKILTSSLLALSLAACAGKGDFDETGGVKIVRSACPAIAVPAFTGDVTLFNPPASRDAAAIDVVATITNVRTTCNDTGAQIVATATFDVLGRRNSTVGPRDVVLPYFATVTRAGSQIVSKQVGRVALHFEDGQLRAQTNSTATASISHAEASLPPAIEERLNRKRKPGDADAAVDPMTEPAIRMAVSKASFELLVGFQLSNDQLAYNATR